MRLEPLRAEHAEALAGLTVGTGLTRWFPAPLETRAALDRFVSTALDLAAKGQALPFAIIAPRDGAIAGTTRFGNIAAEHRRVEIGWTFVGRPWQRTAVNTAAKLLLLEYAFTRLGCVRVELKTDALNAVSRAAILRLGATEEGTLRRHLKRVDGTYRDTVYFSILDSEWPSVRVRLAGRLGLNHGEA